MTSKVFSFAQVTAIVVLALLIFGGVYFGINTYNDKQEKLNLEKDQQTMELGKARQEIEELKKEDVDTTEKVILCEGNQPEVPASASTPNSESLMIKNYVSALENSYIPERTRFYKIDDCLDRSFDGELETEKAFEDCTRQVWTKESTTLQSLNVLFDSIVVPPSLRIYADKERLSLYSYGLCRENQIRLLNGGSLYGFSMAECNDKTLVIFREAQNEMQRVKKLYGL